MGDDANKVLTLKDSEGQAVTFQVGSVVAVATTADRETSTIMLGRDVQITVSGNGEKLRKRIFGAAFGAAKLRTKKGDASRPAAARDPNRPRRRKVSPNGSDSVRA